MTEEIIAAPKTTFDAATSWVRYAPNCWVLWTNRSIAEWHERINATKGLPEHYGASILALESPENRGPDIRLGVEMV